MKLRGVKKAAAVLVKTKDFMKPIFIVLRVLGDGFHVPGYF